MSSATRYGVTYTERVREQILTLSDATREGGDAPAFLAALAEFHHRLHVYPQFGEPLMGLQTEDGVTRLGVVAPLTMSYAVYEARRLVMVAALPLLLRRAKA